jgi:group I intron endonuclease
MKRYIIYRWCNKINGKCYVGLTSNSKSRKRHHIQGYSPKCWLHQAIKKHGIELFDYDELETGLTKEEAIIKEREYILENNAFNHGYNQTPGGYHITGPKSGEKHHNAVITEKIAIDIINDPESKIKVSKKYGISIGVVYHIRSGNTWTHLDRSKAPVYKDGRIKITKDIARKIFLDNRPQPIIAEEYKIDPSTVSNIKRRTRWKDVTKDL